MQRKISCVVTAIAWLMVTACLHAAEDAVIFPLPFYEEALIVPVTINGDEHLFLLDSGSSMHVFHSTFADSLGEPLGERRSSENGGARFEYQAFMPPEAMLGSMPMPRNSPVACVDLSTPRAALGREISGILGMPLFAACIIQLDFDKREIRLMPGSVQPSKEWGEPVSVVFSESDLPHVSAHFSQYENERCMVDTGATGSLSLRKEVFDYLCGLRTITSLPKVQVATIAGIKDAQRGVLDEFELALKTHRNLIVNDGGSKSFLGLKFLRRYLVTFDLGRGQIYFLPGFDYERPDEESIIGIGMLRRDKKTVVEAVYPDSRATEAGFRIGDELLSIEGVDVFGKPIAEIVWMLRAPAEANGTKPLSIERNGEHLTLHLKDK